MHSLTNDTGIARTFIHSLFTIKINYTISLVLFLLVLAIVSVFMGLFKKESYRSENGRFRGTGVVKPLPALAVSFFVVIINPINVERIDAGHVGIKVSNVGDDRGVAKLNM